MTKHRDGLLPRMEARVWSDGVTVSYRYHPLGKKPINLGQDPEAAIRKVLDMQGERDTHGTLKWVWEQFSDADKPAKRWGKLSDGTRADYRTAWKAIEQHSGWAADPIASITSPMVARYVHIIRADTPRRADIEKSLLSNIFKHGILLGVCTDNPTLVVEPHGSEPSTVLPDEAVLAGFLAWLDQQTPQRRIAGMYAEYTSLAGNRRAETLDLTWMQIDMNGDEPVLGGNIRVKRAKQRGARRGEVVELIEITPAMADLLRRLRALNRECLYVFPTEGNNAYNTSGFKTMWGRCVAAAIKAGKLTKDTRFNFHSLRAYYATMHKRDRGSLPDLHANPATTARVYDRNKEVKRRAL